MNLYKSKRERPSGSKVNNSSPIRGTRDDDPQIYRDRELLEWAKSYPGGPSGYDDRAP